MVGKLVDPRLSLFIKLGRMTENGGPQTLTGVGVALSSPLLAYESLKDVLNAIGAQDNPVLIRELTKNIPIMGVTLAIGWRLQAPRSLSGGEGI